MISDEEIAEAALKINGAYKAELAFEDVCGAWEKYIEVWNQEPDRLRQELENSQLTGTQLPIGQDLHFATAFLLTRMTVFWDRDQAINGKNKNNERIGIIFFLRNYTEHVGTLRGHIAVESLVTEANPLKEEAGIGIILEELLTHDKTFQKNKNNREKLEKFRRQNPGIDKCNMSLELGREFRRILERYLSCSSSANNEAENTFKNFWKKYPDDEANPNDTLRKLLANDRTRIELRKINRERLDDFTPHRENSPA